MKDFLKKNWMVIVALVYLLSPVDFIPDVLPVLGASDDVLVLLATLFIKWRQRHGNA
jgi:uncharacterized membrane protein YkvA (DUF1232 family)